jgi:hypothetical protein
MISQVYNSEDLGATVFANSLIITQLFFWKVICIYTSVNYTYENYNSFFVVVYPFCPMLAAGAGNDIPPSTGLVNIYSLQNSRLYPGNDLQIYRRCADVSFQGAQVHLAASYIDSFF